MPAPAAPAGDLPTVAGLCRALGPDLAPLVPAEPPEVPLTAVHISELEDPTAYLSGGELLLTTGLNLPLTSIGCAAYVAGLIRNGVAALGLGLGPRHQRVPDVLAEACRTQGLPLLVVPDRTPFLRVTHAYWTARARGTQQQLRHAAAAHHGLATAAASEQPQPALLRVLARFVGGWAVVLGTDGLLQDAAPDDLGEVRPDLEAAVAKLHGAGIHSSVSFVTRDQVALLLPLTTGRHVVGYLGVGTPAPLDQAARHVVHTAAALLSLDRAGASPRRRRQTATAHHLALLLDLGHVDAARALAGATGSPALPDTPRLLVTRSRSSVDLATVVQTWCPQVGAVAAGPDETWFVLPRDHPDLTDLRERLLTADPASSTIVSPPVPVDAVGRRRAQLVREVRRLEPGVVRVEDDGPTPTQVDAALDRLTACDRGGLVPALTAYLRHRGHWERAAQALGLHRNTLRYRVTRASELLDLDLDDPDVAAHLWLGLRRRGLAGD